ncbi:hypothetical protein [Streptomyces sp. NPDC002057]|uniref:hypothetical protein n=1 Tax=Streptomyces sp. NPDC002057 TaxID=3154664 RepID=UPI00332FE2F7
MASTGPRWCVGRPRCVRTLLVVPPGPVRTSTAGRTGTEPTSEPEPAGRVGRFAPSSATGPSQSPSSRSSSGTSPPPRAAPTATSSAGTDSQWQATGDLIEQIAADIRHFEAEKKRHLAAAASDQTAINNAKDRLARVVTSAARMQMPQVAIAHRAGRSRE